jgi:hypothetical protein
MIDEKTCIEAWLVANGATRLDDPDAESRGISRWSVPGHQGAVHDGGVPTGSPLSGGEQVRRSLVLQ